MVEQIMDTHLQPHLPDYNSLEFDPEFEIMCREKAAVSGINLDFIRNCEIQHRLKKLREEKAKTDVIDQSPTETKNQPQPKRQCIRNKRDSQTNTKRINIDGYYNLRKRMHKPLLRISNNDIVINDLIEPDCFKDRILSRVNINLYHAHTPMIDLARETLKLYKINQRSQLDCFTHNGSRFFVKTWLTTARIFEHNSKNSSYTEVKRIPQRHIKMAPNLITSAHFFDNNLYIAYLINKEDCPRLEEKVSYLEIRDLFGKLLAEPYYYDQVVKSIDSKADFIYVITVKNVVYIHHKRNFNFRVFIVDMNYITSDPLVNLTAKTLHNNSHSSVQLVASTSKSMIISIYSPLSHSVWQNFNFESTNEFGYSTKATHFVQNDLIVIRRKLVDFNSRSEHRSLCRIILGRLSRPDLKTAKYQYFFHEATICLNYDVSQIECDHQDRLYILGSIKDENDVCRYELGCIYIKDLKPLWVMPLKEADSDTKILVHTDHVILVRSCQDDYCINFAKFAKNSPRCDVCSIELPNQKPCKHEYHPGMFRDIKILCNKALIEDASSSENVS